MAAAGVKSKQQDSTSPFILFGCTSAASGRQTWLRSLLLHQILLVESLKQTSYVCVWEPPGTAHECWVGFGGRLSTELAVKAGRAGLETLEVVD